MRLLVAFPVVLLLVAPPRAAADEPDPLRTRAAADLKLYYTAEGRSRHEPSLWHAPLKQLTSDRTEDRKLAAAYLVALLAQALDDETSGTSPWSATPFFGESARNESREVRRWLGYGLEKKKLPTEAVPVLRWYLEHEPHASLVEPILSALAKLDGPEAHALRVAIATQPKVTAAAATAVNQIAVRKGTEPTAQLAALCHHYRPAVRSAARRLNTQMGGTDPGPFDAAKAVRSAPVRRLVEEVGALLPELPPAGAEFVAVTVTPVGRRDGGREWVVRGWLLKRDGDTVEVLTPHGGRETYRRLLTDEAKRREEALDLTVETVSPAAEVARIEAAWAKGVVVAPLHGREGTPVWLYEVVLAHSLHAAGRDDLAARLLLPALDAFHADEDLVSMVKRRVGVALGYQMLAAFVGDRDYARASQLAKRLAAGYPRTAFSDVAARLATELPKRRDDFVELTLPTPAEWATRKRALTRVQQIEFLCRRLRLLNCFQHSQPGGVKPFDRQYAEPGGITPDAAWQLRRGKTDVINPLVELAGDGATAGLALTLADIPNLAEHLRDDWFMLAVSFWRDFAADRDLSRTRPLVADVINRLATADVCLVSRWDRLAAADRGKEIERVAHWARAHAGERGTALRLTAVEEAVRAGAGWRDVASNVERLWSDKNGKAAGVMRQFLERQGTPWYDRSAILELFRQHDPAAAKDLATAGLRDPDVGVRLQAGMLLLGAGERDAARKALGNALELTDTHDWHLDQWLAEAVDTLVKEGSSESVTAASRVLANKSLAEFDSGALARIRKRLEGAVRP